MENNNCSSCQNHGKSELAENTGWYSECKLGLPNDGLRDIASCESYIPNTGFQIGGCYSNIHFEYEKDIPNPCMEMIFHHDGEFPTENKEEQMVFHICDFTQLEHFVKVWGDYFRKKGVIKDNA